MTHLGKYSVYNLFIYGLFNVAVAQIM